MTGINHAATLLLTEHQQLLAAHRGRLYTFTAAPEVHTLATDYEKFSKREIDAGFNLFLLISDTYRLEIFTAISLKPC